MSVATIPIKEPFKEPVREPVKVAPKPGPSSPNTRAPLTLDPHPAGSALTADQDESPLGLVLDLPVNPRPASRPKTQSTGPPMLPPLTAPLKPIVHVEPTIDNPWNDSVKILREDVVPALADNVVPAAAAAMTPKQQTGSVTTLTGRVETWRKTHRLRYARVDADDAHGGSVMLIGADLDQLEDGQQIRVEGQMMPSEDRHGARFEVQLLQVTK